MNHFRKLFIMTVVIAFFAMNYFVVIKTNSVGAAGIKTTVNNSGISVAPEGPLFNLINMAPGDTKSSVFSVISNLDQAYPVYLSSKMESGAEMLYKALIITVKSNDETNTFYNGPLCNLVNVELDTTKLNETTDYHISVLFPTSAGNEFQEKTMMANLIFSTRSFEEIGSSKKAMPLLNNNKTPLTGDPSMTILIILANLSLSALLFIFIKKLRVHHK